MQVTQRPPSGPAKKPKGGDLSKLLSTRGGLVAIGLAAALIAAALLTVFLHNYKKNLTDESAQTVLVAKSVIPKGSSGDVVAAQNLFQTSRVQGNQLKDGAITDPAALKGKVTNTTIFPGQQLTSANFTSGDGAVNTKIAADSRAIAVPLDPAHGMIGDVHAGDHVDIYGSYGASRTPLRRATGTDTSLVKVLIRNATVLKAPDKPKSNTAGTQTQNVIVEAPDTISEQVAYTVDNGLVWLVERPQAGARDSQITTQNQDSILRSTPPDGGAR